MEKILGVVLNINSVPKKSRVTKVKLTDTMIYFPSDFCIKNGIYNSDKYSFKFIEKETILMFRDNLDGFKLNKTGGAKSRTCELLHKNLCSMIKAQYIGCGISEKNIEFQEKGTNNGIELRPIRLKKQQTIFQ